jgi:hypothetical protein
MKVVVTAPSGNCCLAESNATSHCDVSARRPTESADNLFRVSVQHDDDLQPAEGLDHDLGQVKAPSLIRRRRPGRAPRWRPSRLQPGRARYEQPMCSHQPHNALLVDSQPLRDVQLSSDLAIAPKWMLRFHRQDPYQPPACFASRPLASDGTSCP